MESLHPISFDTSLLKEEQSLGFSLIDRLIQVSYVSFKGASNDCLILSKQYFNRRIWRKMLKVRNCEQLPQALHIGCYENEVLHWLHMKEFFVSLQLKNLIVKGEVTMKNHGIHEYFGMISSLKLNTISVIEWHFNIKQFWRFLSSIRHVEKLYLFRWEFHLERHKDLGQAFDKCRIKFIKILFPFQTSLTKKQISALFTLIFRQLAEYDSVRESLKQVSRTNGLLKSKLKKLLENAGFPNVKLLD
jgi:hypothetical protein